MSDTVIKVENISKLYRLGEVGTGTLRHDFNRWWHKARGREDPYLKIGQVNDRAVKGESDYVWALKDVSFEVKRGEVLGIIGRNGAGKSTLLKILSRVTTPTSGEIKVKGRIASLLEVGTGFHPELTGRDNIYLNGAILGMRKGEIDRKFDEIVAFAEVERYIDTPVKRYSSGMYVRLAFAVAAHLEPEILIVDEVLAVGDAEFQKKCLGKIRSVSVDQGRTVLFVSHNLAAIMDLCSNGLVLNQGRAVFLGGVKDACGIYAGTCRSLHKIRRTTGIFRSISLIDEEGKPTAAFNGVGSLRFRCTVRPSEDECLVSLIIRDGNAYALFELFDKLFSPPCCVDSDVELQIDAGNIPLRPGQYSVDFWCGNRFAGRLELLDMVLEFEVVTSENTGPNAKLYRSASISFKLAG